jgi:YVTN family beta-propeller protein
MTRIVPGLRWPLMTAVFILFAAGPWAQAGSVTPAARLLILEKDDRTLAVVDPGSLAIVGRVPAGNDPHEVVATADGTRAYISNYGASATPLRTLSVVDLIAMKPLHSVDLGALQAPHGLDIVAGRIYFTAEGSKAIGRYDPASDRIDWVLGLGRDRTHMLRVAPDGRRIYTANVNSNSITIVEAAERADVSGWAATDVGVGDGPEGFDVSPDGRELWAANSHDGTVSIVDLASRKVVQTLNIHTGMSNRLRFTPDGRRALISDLRSGELIELDAQTRLELKRVGLGRSASGILMAPDGRHAYVALSRDNCVAIVAIDGLGVAARIPTGRGPDGMAWAASFDTK